MSAPRVHAWIESPLVAFFESVGVLVGDELKVALSGLDGWDAVKACDVDGFWVETRLLAAEGRVVVVAGEALVRTLGAKLLMLPEAPTEVTDEIELAFDEIVNVAIGAWNREVSDEERRWNNGVESRSQRRVDVLREVAGQPDGSLRAVGFTLTTEEGTSTLALIGTGEWLGEPAVVTLPPDLPEPEAAVEAVVPSPPTEAENEAVAPAEPATAAVEAGAGEASPPSPPPEPEEAAQQVGSNVTPFRPVTSNRDRPRTGAQRRPATGARGRPTTGAAAAVIPAFASEEDIDPGVRGDVAVVDVSGLFLKWFYEQLRNPDFVFSHCPEGFLDKGEYRAVLLVHPRELRSASLAFDKTIIMRRS